VTTERFWASEILVIQILRDHPQGLYGLEIIQKSEGRLGRGTVYVPLGRLQERGYVERQDEPSQHGGLPRPRYRLTRDGTRVAVEDPGSTLTDGDLVYRASFAA
jgi:DNA-binding PadR family transcriptional regulator